MPVSCSAINCTNRRTPDSNLSFFKFPLSNPKLTKQWILAMKRDKWTPTKYSFLCSDHFVEKNFRHNNDRRYLQPNVVPSVFKFPAHIQPKVCKRPSPKKRAHESEEEPEPAVEDGGTPILVTHPSTSSDHTYHLPSPKKVKKMFEEKKEECEMLRKKLHLAKQDAKRQREKCANLQKVTLGLRKRLCETGALITEHCFEGVLKDLLLNHANGFKNNEYPESVKTFALTLHFYSAKAYTYLRKFIKLPHPRTIRHWALAVDGRPGFTVESFNKIKSEVNKSKVPILGCLMLDEIAIKKQLDWDGKQIVGHCDLGNAAVDDESCPVAREALVFMLTAVNQSWKIPIGYSLINGINADTKVNLIKLYLRKLHETGVRVIALTCDGTSTNKTMLETLGVNINNDNTKCWFEHPSDASHKVYCLLDAAHMLKLTRNLIGEKKLLVDGTVNTYYGNKVDWKYFVELEKLQSMEGLHAGNKLRRQHIEWQRQKMKVALAAQTLSNSVGNAMEFCRDLGLKEFQDCESTVKFVKMVDVIFDLLNSCHPHGIGTKHPITIKNKALVKKRVRDGVQYLKSLRLADGTPVLQSNRKTPIYGLILDLLSVQAIAEEFVWCENPVLRFLLTRRLSQDHLEMFFASIRNRGGNSNNPTALQFRSAYRKCLIARIDPSLHGNCQLIDDTELLSLGLATKTARPTDASVSQLDFDHDYIPEYSSLSLFCENVVEYIAGNVVRACSKKLVCSECLDCLFADANTPKRGLILQKDVKNGLFNPSRDVLKLCSTAERVLRSHDILANKGDGKVMFKLICTTMRSLPPRVFADCPHLYLGSELSEESHFSILTKLLLKQYFTIRIHHECRQHSATLRGTAVRQVLTKLILFKGQ